MCLHGNSLYFLHCLARAGEPRTAVAEESPKTAMGVPGRGKVAQKKTGFILKNQMLTFTFLP